MKLNGTRSKFKVIFAAALLLMLRPACQRGGEWLQH